MPTSLRAGEVPGVPWWLRWGPPNLVVSVFVKLICLVDALQQEDLQLTTECYCNLIREKKEIEINCGSVMFFVIILLLKFKH